MSSVVSAPVRKNDTPLKGRQPRKFTLENIARIKDWIAQGLGRDDIANRLEVTVGSLQVTCSRLGISLRKGRRAERNGAIQSLRTAQRSIARRRSRSSKGHDVDPKTKQGGTV
jgi:hypothetical protein